MIRRYQLFTDALDSTYIAETFISGFSEITTICGSAPSNAEVWIKVCDMKSLNAPRGLHIITQV